MTAKQPIEVRGVTRAWAVVPNFDAPNGDIVVESDALSGPQSALGREVTIHLIPGDLAEILLSFPVTLLEPETFLALKTVILRLSEIQAQRNSKVKL